MPRILVCEDESALRELIRVTLGARFTVVEAADGRRALELARLEPPDAVIVDLMLPQRSGIEVVRELRADPRTARVPVLVISAWTELDTEAVEAGADAFLPKPFDPLELQACVEGLVSE